MPQPRAGTWHDQRVPSPARRPAIAAAASARAPRGRIRWAALLAVLLVGLITACGVRLDLPPSPPPVPEGQDAVRQEAAIAVESLARYARSAAEQAAGETAESLDAVARDAEAHLTSLGGVWQPPPRPEAGETGTGAGDQADRDGDHAEGEDAHTAAPAEVVEHLEDTAAALLSHIDEVDGQMATLLTSVAVNQVLHARQVRAALDLDPPEPPALPEDPFPAEFGPEAAGLSRLLDASGYVAEVRAARAGGEERSRLSDHAARMRAQGAEVAVRAGLAATEDDPREPAYELDLDDLHGQAVRLAHARVPAWLHLVEPAAPEDRDLIAAQVLATAMSVYDVADPVPVLPGLDVSAGTEPEPAG